MSGPSIATGIVAMASSNSGLSLSSIGSQVELVEVVEVELAEEADRVPSGAY